MTHRTVFVGLLFALTCVATPSLAQDPESALLEGDVEGSGLIERRHVEPVEHVDPLPKLHEAVEQARKSFENRLNGVQGLAAKFLDLNEPLGNVTAAFLKAQENYLEAHLAAMTAYQGAVEAKDEKARKRQLTVITKLRKGYLRDVKKANRAADKFDKAAAKIQKLAAEEDAEDAAGDE